MRRAQCRRRKRGLPGRLLLRMGETRMWMVGLLNDNLILEEVIQGSAKMSMLG